MSKKQINAAAWFSQQNFVGRMELPKPVRPESPKITAVDRWVDGKWVTVLLKWDGEKYVECNEAN